MPKSNVLIQGCKRGKTAEPDRNLRPGFSHASPLVPTNRISISVRLTRQRFILYLSCQFEIHVHITMVVFSRHINSLNARQKRSLLMLLFSVLLLRSRLITGPRDVFTALKKAAGIQKPTPEELEQARQQLYCKNPDGTKNLLITYRNQISEVSTVCLGKSDIAS